MSEAVERAWRLERAGVVATLARRLGDLDLAEDAVQDAFASAVTAWARDGVPERPGAWLTVVAWRRALDVLRRARPAASIDRLVAEPRHEDELWPALAVEDDLLALVLACCHPALAADARVALTLRHVAGLTAPEIAAAFLVGPDTMAKRLVRARRKLRDASVSFELPQRDVLHQRLASAQAVISLIFTEGHLASGDGPGVRAQLCDEAVWLARQLHHLVPADDETTGLLATLVLHHARTPARLDADGRLVTFTEQDRSLWDPDAVTEAKRLLMGTGRGPLGPHQVQAAIALVHATAADGDRGPWLHVARLYGILATLTPSPVVEANRAVAVAHAHGAAAGLAVLQPVLSDERVQEYPPLHAAHADLLERSGRPTEALAAWRRAIAACSNPDQRRALQHRADELVAGVLSSPTDAS